MMSPSPFARLPELPLRAIFDELSDTPGARSRDACALSATCPALNAFYRDAYVTRLALGGAAACAPAGPLDAAAVFRLLARFRRAAALDVRGGVALAACGDLRVALAGPAAGGAAGGAARAARIRELRLAQPMSRSDIAAVADVCPRLERLELCDQRALDVGAIARLADLRDLRLVHCFAAGVDFAPLAALRRLERLVLTETKMDRDALAACLPGGMARSLNFLDVRWSGALTLAAIAVLPTTLVQLLVDMRTHAFPATSSENGTGLAVPNLTRLTVNGSGGAGNVLYESTSITRLWLIPLASQLKYLDVCDFDFSDGGEAVARCFESMQRLEELRIGHVSVEVAHALASLPRLRSLSFNEATLSADVVGALGNGPARDSLQHVDFRRCMYVSPVAVAGLRLALTSPMADVICR